MSRTDSHWVVKGDTAQAALAAQGYEVDRNARGRRGWVLMVKQLTAPDYDVTFDGSSLYLVRPLTDAAGEHLRENVDDEAQWFGGALVVEHRYIGGLIEGLTGNGYRVRVL